MLTVLPHSTFTTKNFAPGTTTATGTTPGAQTAGSTTGSISAASPRDIARLEEGKRTRRAYKYITTDALNAATQSGVLPTWMQINGEWYEVSTIDVWQNGVMPHYEYIVTKIENPGDRA